MPKREEVTRDWRILHVLRGSCSVLSEYCSGVIKRNPIDEASGMYEGEERYVQGFGGENLREKDHLEGLDIDGNIISIWILKELG